MATRRKGRKPVRRSKPRKRKFVKHKKKKFRSKNVCQYCGKRLEDVLLPYICKFCGKRFCSEHRLPEGHECRGLSRYKKKKIKKFRAGKSNINYESDITYNDNRKPHSRDSKPIKRKTSFSPNIRKLKYMIKKTLPGSVWLKLILALIIISIIEYFYIKQYLMTTLYLLDIVIVSFIIYKLFKKAEHMRIESDLGIFGLRILSGIAFFVGIFLIYLTMISASLSAFYNINNPITSLFHVFLGLLGLGLILLSAYLLFKFKLRSGIIVHRGL